MMLSYLVVLRHLAQVTFTSMLIIIRYHLLIHFRSPHDACHYRQEGCAYHVRACKQDLRDLHLDVWDI
jgi:hypothetical protein